MNKMCIIAFTKNAVKLAEKINKGDIYAYYKYSSAKHISFNKIDDIMEKCWKEYDTILFISACGIAVRSIAQYLTDKRTDPAVAVCDEKGSYVISLVSGHIGGANEVAREIASVTGGTAVITTATDVLNKLAIDMWAKNNKLVIEDMTMAKEVSAAIVNGEEVGYIGSVEMPDGLSDNKNADIGVYVGYKIEKPFKKTLILAEKCLVLGIGCKNNTPFENIKSAVAKLFERENLNINSVKMIASVSVKANEPGIIMLANEIGVNFATYAVNYLENIEGSFSYSEFVKEKIGLDCVCERAALAKGGRLIVPKQKFEGVTLAVARL